MSEPYLISRDAVPGTAAVEMPCAIVAMENIDGRLMVVLEDGRTVDMTDMFSGQALQ